MSTDSPKTIRPRRRSGRALPLLVGLVGAVALGGLLPLGLWAAGHAARDTLAVEMRGADPFQRAPTARRMPAVQVSPESVGERLESAGEPDWTSPGLAFRQWRLSYGHRWEREVTLPLFLGEVDSELLPTCGYALRIGPGVFDPDVGGGPLREVARRELRRQFPLVIPCGLSTKVTLPKLETTDVELAFRDGTIAITVTATLADGTRVGAQTGITLEAVDGQLQVAQRGQLQPIFEGPAWRACSSTLTVRAIDLWRAVVNDEDESIIIDIARSEIKKQLAPVVAELNRALGGLHQPFGLFPDRPQDRLALHLQRAPRIGPDGVRFDLCTTLTLPAPRVAMKIGGPPLVAAAPPELAAAPADGRPTIELVANAVGINQIVYVLWQTGRLRTWGTSSLLLDRLPEHIKALAFEVEGFDPQLPPVVLPRSPGVRLERGWLPLRVANVAMGRWDGRTVMGHADLGVRVTTDDDGVWLAGNITDPTANCIRERDDGGWRLTPCLSDLLPAVRGAIRDQAPRFAVDLSAILRALSRHTFEGLHFELSGLVATSASSPPRLHSRVTAQLASAAAE